MFPIATFIVIIYTQRIGHNSLFAAKNRQKIIKTQYFKVQDLK